LEVTDIRVTVLGQPLTKVRAYVTVTLDGCFVVRDMRVVETPSGLLVAMPSAPKTAPCPQCWTKNSLRAKFCNECGRRLHEHRGPSRKLYSDLAHPGTPESREYITEKVLEAYEAALAEQEAGAQGTGGS
jgi:stage V sporulation protein G